MIELAGFIDSQLLSNIVFKADAKKWLMPSVAGENIISGNKLADLKGEKLVLIIGRYTPLTDSDHITILNLPPKQLLDKKYIRLIRHHRGPVLLCSSDISMISRLWMILSQMGCSNLYILTNNSDNETLRYSFQPDSSSFVKI